MTSSSDPASLRSEFTLLHESGIFVMPNAWDVGSALVLQSLGFSAIATTSSGLAAALGRHDQNVSFAELAVHVADLCSVLDVPLSVDSEAGYSADVGGLPRTVTQLAAAGAAGLSIEDYIPGRGIIGVDEATERVAVFTSAAHDEGVVVTARAENHLYGIGDLDDTIGRLRSYATAGADVVYAPGLTTTADISRVVEETGSPVNVLLLEEGPDVSELGTLGVRRVSTGGSFAFSAYGALDRAGRELRDHGSKAYLSDVLDRADRKAAFGDE